MLDIVVENVRQESGYRGQFMSVRENAESLGQVARRDSTGRVFYFRSAIVSVSGPSTAR